ncbi:uncharacterized protein ACIBXB_002915 [Morphnus guianensis]
MDGESVEFPGAPGVPGIQEKGTATEQKHLEWNKETERAFELLKKALMSAPALGLPDVSKPFLLYSHEKQGIALGILAQNLGPYRRAVAYLSKQLDTTAKGWPGCLRAVAAVILNIQEARKFTLGQKMTLLVSHTVSAVLEAKGGHWLSPQRFLRYQAILVEQDDVEIVVTNIVNPASFLSGNTGEPVMEQILQESISKHLKDKKGTVNCQHELNKGQAGDDWLEGRSAKEDLGVWVDSKWDRRKQCGLGMRNANSILGWISKITASRENEVTLPLYSGTASGLPCLMWGFPA